MMKDIVVKVGKMSNNEEKIVTAAAIVIGNEILSGRTQDTNSNWIAKELTRYGIRLIEVRVIPDIEETIVDTLNELRTKVNYVFTTGGIGPTHDDITAACVAKAFGVELERNQEAHEILENHYGDDLTEARDSMAIMPVGVKLIENPVSAAPGFVLDNVHVMAGIPNIMKVMLDAVLNNLELGTPLLSNTITCTIPESEISEELSSIQDTYPDVEIGSYPNFRGGKTGLSVVLRSSNEDLLKKSTKDVIALIEKMGEAPSAMSLQAAV